MKLAVVTTSASRSAGGLFESVRGCARELAKRPDFEQVVVACRDTHSETDDSKWRPIRVRYHDIRGPRNFAWAPEIPTTLEDEAPDLVHLHGLWQYPSRAVLRWSQATGRPRLISPRGMLEPWALANSSWKKKLAAVAFERANLLGATCVHALSEAEAESIRNYGYGGPVAVIPNGVELPDPAVRLSPPWEGFVEPGSKVLLYLGRLHPKKNLPALITAWARFSGSTDGAEAWSLVIAGWDEDGHRRELEKLVQREGARGVVLLGPQYNESKRVCFSNAAAFVLPSLSEGVPMAVLEAWAYGLPVLMTAECHLEDGFDRGAALRIGTSEDALAESLVELVKIDAARLSEIGLRGYRLVEERYTWGRIAEKMNGVYQWMLGGGPPPDTVRNL